MSSFAPVVIFAYRRPEHLRAMLSSLALCNGFLQSPVIVYFDGPRDKEDIQAVNATRELAISMLGARAEYYFSEKNLGLSQSIINGVGETLNRFGRVIVLEDDLELAPSFLTFMNRALDRYENDLNVFQVSGYIHAVPRLQDISTALFLPFTTSWGWATWKRAWDSFDLEAKGWESLTVNDELRRRFNLGGAYDYATMLFRQMSGLRDSWAIRWYWTVFRSNGLVIYPPISLVKNIGFDGSGTHGSGMLRKFSAEKKMKSNFECNGDIDFPANISINPQLYHDVKLALWKKNGGWITYGLDYLKSFFNF